jgi:dihydroorotase
MASLLIKGGWVVDPASGLDGKADILITNGRIEQIGTIRTASQDEKIIDADGLHVFPGLVDAHVHFRDPGFTHKEDINSGSKAALAGGFTSVIQMPNTKPPLSTPQLVQEYTRKSPVRTYVFASVTKDRKGRQLNDFKALLDAGAVGFSDDGSPIKNPNLMKKALEFSKSMNFRIAAHEENLDLAGGGVMIDGGIAWNMGYKGIDRWTESSMVKRDIEILRKTGGYLHICHVSSRYSINQIRKAKDEGLNITAEVTPHHLVLNHEGVVVYGANAKMNPPLNYDEDREACVAALCDGTIDIIASDHAPHTVDEKSKPFETAPFGIIGLETSFPICYTYLVKNNKMSLIELIEKMSLIPSTLFNLTGGRIKIGDEADITIADLQNEYQIDLSNFKSKSRNTPFDSFIVTGKIKHTIVNGELAC